MVILGFPTIPHPFLQALESTQFPANPQSVAAMTVVGQKPHNAFCVSTRQLKPASAVRGWLASPFKKPQVDTKAVACRFFRSSGRNDVGSDVLYGEIIELRFCGETEPADTSLP